MLLIFFLKDEIQVSQKLTSGSVRLRLHKKLVFSSRILSVVRTPVCNRPSSTGMNLDTFQVLALSILLDSQSKRVWVCKYIIYILYINIYIFSIYKVCHPHNQFQNRIGQPYKLCSADNSGTWVNTVGQDTYVIKNNIDCIFYTVALD